METAKLNGIATCDERFVAIAPEGMTRPKTKKGGTAAPPSSFCSAVLTGSIVLEEGRNEVGIAAFATLGPGTS
jgi:hypothetical protein